MSVDFRCDIRSGREFAAVLRRDAALLLTMLNLEAAELSIILIGDRAIRQLNRDFRGKDTPTDVLSFPLIDGTSDWTALAANHATEARPPLALGDIVISVDTAQRQAVAMRQPVAERLRALLIHGLLHLLGYDHERSPSEARRMFARERQLAASLDERVARKPRSANMAKVLRANHGS